MLAAGCGARSSLDTDPESAGDAAPPILEAGMVPPLAEAGVDARTDSHPECEGVTTPLGPACNTLAFVGSPIPVNCVPGKAPTPTGGTVADGLYVLVASTLYGACPNSEEEDRIVWSVCGSATWATAQESSSAGVLKDEWINVSVQWQGTSLVATPICGPPGTPTETFGYDATPDTLTIHVDYGGSRRLDRFARQ